VNISCCVVTFEVSPLHVVIICRLDKIVDYQVNITSSNK
jgi:hypothetical protein